MLIGLIASSLKKAVSDLFNRTTSGSLGTSDSGSLWNALRGTWYANGSQAQSDDSESTYPIASIALSDNVTVGASVNSGTGVAFWISDAGSWWAATSYNNSSTSSYSYSCNCVSCNCTSYSYACGQSYGGYVCTSYRNYTCVSGYTVWNTVYCTSTSCSTCCGTCTGYTTTTNYYLRLVSSVGGTVSTATGDVSLGSQPAAISVTTNGNLISAKAWSDTAKTSLLGSELSYTPASPTKGSGVGIIKAPTDYSQQSVVDDFTAGI